MTDFEEVRTVFQWHVLADAWELGLHSEAMAASHAIYLLLEWSNAAATDVWDELAALWREKHRAKQAEKTRKGLKSRDEKGGISFTSSRPYRIRKVIMCGLHQLLLTLQQHKLSSLRMCLVAVVKSFG